MQQHELTLYEVSKAVTFIESENGTVVTRAWGRGKWGVIDQWAESFRSPTRKSPRTLLYNVVQ